MVVRGARLSIGMTASPMLCPMMASLFVIQRTLWNLRVLQEMNVGAVPRRLSRMKVPVKTVLKAIHRS